jgi:RNA polymerase sigma-32 factor
MMANSTENFVMRPRNDHSGTWIPLVDAKILSEQEEHQLARQFRDGDARAGDRLVCGCLRFVVSIALEYRRLGVPLEDLIQQGNLGLLQAVRRFDPDRNCRLTTYAAYWIRAEILSFMTRTSCIVRGGPVGSNPEGTADDSLGTDNPSRAADARAPEPTTRRRRFRDVSLDQTSEDKVALIDRLADDTPLPDEQYIEHDVQWAAHDCVARAIAKLSEDEAIVARGRWLCEEQVTFDELAGRLGTTREQVRRIEERVRHRLQSHLAPWASLVA